MFGIFLNMLFVSTFCFSAWSNLLNLVFIEIYFFFFRDFAMEMLEIWFWIKVCSTLFERGTTKISCAFLWFQLWFCCVKYQKYLCIIGIVASYYLSCFQFDWAIQAKMDLLWFSCVSVVFLLSFNLFICSLHTPWVLLKGVNLF